MVDDQHCCTPASEDEAGGDGAPPGAHQACDDSDNPDEQRRQVEVGTPRTLEKRIRRSTDQEDQTARHIAEPGTIPLFIQRIRHRIPTLRHSAVYATASSTRLPLAAASATE